MKLRRVEAVPGIFIGNRQRGVQLNLAQLRGLTAEALPLCLRKPGRHEPMLASLEEVEIALVSDRVIAQVHRRFMDVPGATDVITFPHGEIVVSTTTAAREALARGEPVGREVLRYVVHGLLHLNGHEDANQEESAAMWQAQEAVIAELWPNGSL